jgi:2-oxoglutarate ferredoxin oxidoreductase subunit beta
VFNDGTFAHLSDRGYRAERTISLRPGEPLIFGENQDKGLVYNGEDFEVITLQSAEDKNKLHVHQKENGLAMAIKLNELAYPDFPVPMGIFRAIQRPVYEEEIQAQVTQARAKQSDVSLEGLLHSGKTWEIK